MRAACAGVALIAVSAITLVWATSDAEIGGALPSWRRTSCTTGALVASCRSVCTSVVVTCCGVVPREMPWPEDCTRSCAVDEYCFASVSDRARLAASPSTARAITHHFRRRRTTRYECRVAPLPGSAIRCFSPRVRTSPDSWPSPVRQ